MADPEGKEWTRQRVDYQVTRVFLDEQKKAAICCSRSPLTSKSQSRKGESLKITSNLVSFSRRHFPVLY